MLRILEPGVLAVHPSFLSTPPSSVVGSMLPSLFVLGLGLAVAFAVAIYAAKVAQFGGH
jgi:hypothetical protein